jgi:SAM-dependent methyltransferase
MTYSDETYGNQVATVYDEWYAEVDLHAIDRLAELTGSGKALELGIGTGRIALPLSAHGVSVTGIDVSEAMLAQLRNKRGAEKLELHLGSFLTLEGLEQFNLVYVVFNTLFMLTAQSEQVRCFQAVAKHLTDDGVFVVEAFVPDLTRLQFGQANWVQRVTEDVVQLDVGMHDATQQTVTSQKVVLTNGNTRLYPLKIRYAWPSELDLMAQLAGLRLRERWNNWQKTPFDSTSGKHISIYERMSDTL